MKVIFNPEIFGQNARAIRLNNNLSQLEIGKILGFKRSKVGSIEEGRATSLENALIYSAYSGLSINFLILYKIKTNTLKKRIFKPSK